MKDFLGIRKLSITKESLQRVQFQSPSPLAREILLKSNLFSNSLLLSQNSKKYQQAAMTLAKGSVKPE